MQIFTEKHNNLKEHSFMSDVNKAVDFPLFNVSTVKNYLSSIRESFLCVQHAMLLEAFAILRYYAALIGN